MYSSNNPKLSQHTRTQVFALYQTGVYTQTQLASSYGISRQTVSKIIYRARDGDFTIHRPVNHRYLTEEYVRKRIERKELKLAKKAERKAKRLEIQKNRYEHKKPGDLGHIDLKLLSPIKGKKIIKGQKEYLLALVDDCTRISYFTIIQGKSQYQVEAGLKRIFTRCSISFKAILSDNGKEFKGSQVFDKTVGKYKVKTRKEGQGHAVELLLQQMNIKHRYTRVRRPQTNGKVERLNRTIGEEFLTKVKFENRLHRQAELRLWEYHYNQERTHQGIKNMTPHQKLIQLSTLKFL